MKKFKESLIQKVEEIFEHKGFKCIVVLNELITPIKISSMEMKWRCGYVGVTPKHPLYKKDYNKVDNLILAHGGLTFSNFGDGRVLPKDSTWWFGFDCQHFTDTPKIWTFKRVKKEVMELAEQLELRNLILKKLEDD